MSSSAEAAKLRGAVEVRRAVWPQDLPAARRLLQRYFDSLRNDPAVPDVIRSKDRAPELEALPTSYQREDAMLLLASSGGRVLGCVTVHLLPERPGAAELKRLYVLPGARGCGAGRALILACAAWARQHGAAELLLDTLPAAMPAAVRLYRSLGFTPIPRYNGSEGCCFAFFRLPLG